MKWNFASRIRRPARRVCLWLKSRCVCVTLCNLTTAFVSIKRANVLSLFWLLLLIDSKLILRLWLVFVLGCCFSEIFTKFPKWNSLFVLKFLQRNYAFCSTQTKWTSTEEILETKEFALRNWMWRTQRPVARMGLSVLGLECRTNNWANIYFQETDKKAAEKNSK